MIRALRIVDAIFVVLGGRLLAMSYRRFGYAPIATQFTIQIALSLIGGVAGCYLVSRWTLPDTLTGFLLMVGTANMIWMTSSTWPHVRFWTQDMYERSRLMSDQRLRERIFERLLSLMAAVFCLGWMVAQLARGEPTGTAVFLGLASLALSSVVNGYLRCAPPPEPTARVIMPDR